MAQTAQASDDDLDGLLVKVLGALKRKAVGSETLQQELERELKKRQLSPEVQKARALFATPPSRMDATNFSMKYGLVEVRNCTPHYDRFRTLEIKKRPLVAVHVLVGSVVARSLRACLDPDGEAKRQGIHELLLIQFREFTSPRTHDNVEGVHKPREPDPPASIQETETEGEDLVVEDVDEDDEEEDVDEEEDTNTPTTASNRSFVLDPQMQNEEERKGREHADMFAKVYHQDRLVVRLAVDFKTRATNENLYQPAAYVIGSLSRTSGLGSEYRPPVCLQAWDKTTWYYGYIEVDEFIIVEGEEIVQGTLDRFPRTREEAAASVNATERSLPFTQAQVQKKFVAWKSEMKRQGMMILDGKYPVGRLFINRNSHSMPTFVGDDIELSKGAHRFYEGMLKTLVGNKVTKWTSRHVFQTYHQRKEVLDMAEKAGLPKADWEYVPKLKGELDCDNW